MRGVSMPMASCRHVCLKRRAEKGRTGAAFGVADVGERGQDAIEEGVGLTLGLLSGRAHKTP